MRLLLVTPEYPPHAGGGIAKYYQSMTAAWTAAGAEISVVVSTPYSAFEDYTHQGISVCFIPLDRVNRHAERLTHLAAAPTYRRWIAAGLAAADWVRSKADRFDVIEATDFGLLFAPIVSLPDRPPLVVKLHGSSGQISEHEPSTSGTELDAALARMTEAVFLPSVDALHAHSPSNATEWESRLARPVTFVPAPLRLPLPPQAASPSQLMGLVVGRIQSWKGPELLCRAFQCLGTAAPSGLAITWVGRDTASGPGGQSMSAWLAASYQDIWGKRVVPIGARTAADVALLQTSARFVVVPSEWDTFNYTLAEAMALGCLTLGSNGAGSAYLIDHARNGFRFAPDEPDALAQLLIDSYEMNDSARAQIGTVARATVARELDPDASAAASLAALASVRSSRRAEVPGPWMREFLEPNVGRTTSTGYLENVSIRELASHLTTRVTRKIVG